MAEISNPFSTGGGGNRFELLVGAYYLVSLLAEDVPRGVSKGVLTNVRFQQRYDGFIVDDVVLTSQNSVGERRELALQLKHDISFTPSDVLLPSVIADCWEHCQDEGFRFGIDRIGIGFGAQPPAKYKHLYRALEWAKTAKDAEEYFDKLATPKFTSAQAREYIQLIRGHLESAKGASLNDGEMFQFLRSFVVIQFDFQGDTGRDTLYIWNRLLDLIPNRADSVARALSAQLFELVSHHNTHASGFALADLRNKIADFAINSRRSCAADLQTLKRHTNLVLGQIQTSLVGLHLPRSQAVEYVSGIVEMPTTRLVAMVGERGSGKSGLLKLVAKRAESENTVIVTEAVRLIPSGFNAFLSSVDHTLSEILGAISASKYRCLFIDQVDRILVDDRKRRMLGDIFHELHQYNQQLVQHGMDERHCWRLVVTCRAAEWEEIRRKGMLAQYFSADQIQTFQLPPLSEDELSVIEATHPKLSSLRQQSHFQPILHRPFYLDLFLCHSLTLDHLSHVTIKLLEAHLMESFWQTIVRSGNGFSRDKLLQQIAENQLRTGQPFIPYSQLDTTLLERHLPELLSEQIVTEYDGVIRFAHAIFEDWATAKLLETNRHDLSKMIETTQYPYDLMRPAELYLQRKLEIQDNVNAWLSFVNHRWPLGLVDNAIVTFLESPQLRQNLAMIRTSLLDQQLGFLVHILRVLRTECVHDSENMRDLLQYFPDSFEKRYIFLTTKEPIAENWLPIVEFLVAEQTLLPLNALPEIAEICHAWLKSSQRTHRKEVALLSLSYLNEDWSEALDEVLHSDDEIITISLNEGGIADQARRMFTEAVLFSADVVPEQLTHFVRNSLANMRRDEVAAVLLEGANWVNMLVHLPELFIESADKILCWRPKTQAQLDENAEFLRRSVQFTDDWLDASEEAQYRRRCQLPYNASVIQNDHQWFPATDITGPYHLILTAKPEVGLKLIHLVVNHQTNFWKRCHQFMGSTPFSQKIQLSNTTVEVWGNNQIYCWSRVGSAPNAVQCALRALESWLYDQVEKSDNTEITTIFNDVLLGTNSLAVCCVLMSVALKHPLKCATAIMPVLTCPAIWVLDLERAVLETGASTIAGMGAYRLNEAQQKRLYEWETAPHRQLEIDHLAQQILLFGKEQEKRTLSATMASFSKQIPFFDSVESTIASVCLQREKRFDIIASWADPANLEVKIIQTTDDGETLVLVTTPNPIELLHYRTVFRKGN